LPYISQEKTFKRGFVGDGMPQVKTKKLGQILVEAGMITAEKLDLALSEQRQTGEKLGQTLQRLGICSEMDIAQVLASQAGVECVDLGSTEVDSAAARLIDRDLCERKLLLPVSLQGMTLQVAMANPLDLGSIDELTRLTGKYIEVVHAPESEIRDLLTRRFGSSEEGTADLTGLIEDARRALASGVKLGTSDSPFIRLVDQLLSDGIQDGATDIHIEPEEKVLRCRYRLDGHLIQGAILPLELLAIVITRIKIMAELDISESRVPQDGRILFEAGKRKIDLRVSSFPTTNGEAVVCRILDKENLIVGLGKLGMPPAIQESFERDIQRPNGIILVTGPTGSGKTTTLYSALSYLNRPDTKIITLEDPVEYELPLINQAQINTAKGFTFAKGLRAILRQDPDILLVGEIRDVETAQLAIRAALTGHLVFSTLHTNSAVGAIPRLLDMGVEPFLLSATLVSVVAQRLIRTVCPECSQPVEPLVEELSRLGVSADEVAGAEYREGQGCGLCRGTGFRGRRAVFEYLSTGPKIRRMIAEGRDAMEIEQSAEDTDLIRLREDALNNLKNGITTVQEVMRVVI
jgi:type IV pilus assembly protein PilB